MENWASSLAKPEQWTACPDALGADGSSPRSAEDIEYHVDDGRQNQSDNSPNQALASSIGANGHSQVDNVSQWTLEEFPHSCSNKTNSLSELSQPLAQCPQSLIHIWDPGMIWGGCPPPPGTHAVRMLGMASPLLLPFPQEQREQNEHQKRWCHAREPIPPPFPWDTLVHMDMDPSQLHHQHQNKIILSDLLWMSREARGLECGSGQCGQRWGPGSTKQMVHTGSGVSLVWQLLLRCFELVARLE